MKNKKEQIRTVYAMCPECFTLIGEPIRKPASVWSMKTECPHCHKKVTAYLIDEGIAETVSLLNRKGYYTKFCCEGHNRKDGNSLAYIYFDLRMDRILKYFPLPKQWILDSDNPQRPNERAEFWNYVIREQVRKNHEGVLVYDDGRKKDTYRITRAYSAEQRLVPLQKWAESLPDLNGFLRESSGKNSDAFDISLHGLMGR